MIATVLSVGDKLDIRILQELENQDQDGELAHVWKSVIYELKEDGSIEIAMPSEGGKMVLLSLGLRYELVFYTHSGLYRCIGQVKERYKSDNLYIVSVELKTNLSKFQRREFYRLECLLDVKYLPISEEEVTELDEIGIEKVLEYHKKEHPREDLRTGISLDISGGGLRLIAKESLEKHSNILLHFYLSNELGHLEVWLPGIVLQCRQLNQDLKKFECRIMFIMKNTRIREQIIKYIFQEERKNRKNEKR